MKKFLFILVLLASQAVPAQNRAQYLVFGGGYASIDRFLHGTNFFARYRREVTRRFSWDVGLKYVWGNREMLYAMANNTSTDYRRENYVQLSMTASYDLLHSKDDIFALRCGSGAVLLGNFITPLPQADYNPRRVRYWMGVQFILAPVVRLAPRWYVGVDMNLQYFHERLWIVPISSFNAFLQYKL